MSRWRAIRDDVRSGLPLIVGFLVVLALGSLLTLYATGGMRVGVEAERTPEERAELLASGDCAVRPGGEPVGRIVGRLTPSQGMPRHRFQLAGLERRQVLVVYVDEVEVVPCQSLLERDGGSR